MNLGLSDALLGWTLVALLLGLIEIFTVGFFFCFFAVGALIAGFASQFVPGLLPQSLIFVASSLILVVLARPLLKNTLKIGNRPAVDSNVSALLNKPVYVLETVDKYQGRVKVSHTGELWSAYLADPAGAHIPAGQEALIIKVDGAKLAVAPIDS